MATSGGRVCRHLHLPLQSGSTRILRQMARPYSAQRFAGLVDRLRARIPGIALSTDVIATAMRAGLKAADLIDLDLAYAPPYGQAQDPVNQKITQKLIEKVPMTIIAESLSVSTSTVIRKLKEFKF